MRADITSGLTLVTCLGQGPLRSGRLSLRPGFSESVVSECRAYLEAYGQFREAGPADRELFEAMVSRYPDWVNRQQFLLLGWWWDPDTTT